MDIYLNKPYYDIEQKEVLTLNPQQMNSELKLNLKLNLKEKVEGKCNEFGYIDKIYKILTYNDGLMVAENLSGGARYNVNYHCRIYSPLENTSLIGEVILINPDLIIVKNGPIVVFVTSEQINTSVFDINRNYMIKKDKTQLQLNQKAIVVIKKKHINTGDKSIKCMGYLYDIATEKQIKEYYDDDKEIKEETNEESSGSNYIL